MEVLRLPEEVEGRLAALGSVDLLVGVFSYQHAQTIEGVLRGIEKAVLTHFPSARALIVHSDAGSTDGTLEAAGRAAGDVPALHLTHRASASLRAAPPQSSVPGGDEAFRTVCQAARTLAARAVLLVGADLRAVPDASVEQLLRPVWDGELDLVAPLFPRHVLDGALTTCLLYPLTRALYGRAVRQVIASELALSASLVGRLGEAAGWGSGASRSLPLFLTTAAAASDARLGEAWLTPRDGEPSATAPDLGGIVNEVVGGSFLLAELHEEVWREARPGPPPRRLGTAPPAATTLPPINPGRMITVFRQGLRDLAPIWEHALREPTMADLYPLGDLGPEEFQFSATLWARVVYDFLLAHHFRVLHRDHLLRSLVPLYLGRMAALASEAAGQAPAAHDRLVERQVKAFEDARADALDRWR